MEDYKEKYEKLHKKTLAALQQSVSEGKITEETARSICADFVKESEDERIRKAIIYYLDREITLSNFGGDIATFKEWIAWIEKQGEQKHAWSEEDEKHYQGCLNLMKLSLDTKPYPYYNDYLWLKSLKERYTWKPSDEQIRPLGYAIDYFKKKKNDTTYLESLYKDLKKLVEE